MRTLITIILLGVAVIACQESESVPNEFTGNEAVYALNPGSVYQTSGTVTFKEKKDGTALVIVDLKGTEGNAKHPVHLHLGNIATPDADITALLNPVMGKTGKSETLVSKLADESDVTYKQLLELSACVKIHLAEAGPDKDIILAGGNIGKAATDASSGRVSMSVCKSE